MNLKDWNISIVSIVLISVIGIFAYSIFDPSNASKQLSEIYLFLALKFEKTFQYGALFLSLIHI